MMDEEVLKAWDELRKDSRLKQSLAFYARNTEDVDDIFNKLAEKFLSSKAPIITGPPKPYLITALYNQAKKSSMMKRKYSYNSEIILGLMGDDTFSKLFEMGERECLYDELDQALSSLTKKEINSIKDLLNDRNDGSHYFEKNFTNGENINTIRSNRKAALSKLKQHFGIVRKNVNERYLKIFNDHKEGKITNLKKYLRDNNLQYNTYYFNIRHLIPEERKINKNKLTEIQQRALDIYIYTKENNVDVMQYVKSLGLNYNTYKHTLVHVRKKIGVLPIKKETNTNGSGN